MTRFLLTSLALTLTLNLFGAELKTQNIFLITADGLRWQEVFRGAEEMPLTKEFGNFGNSNAIRKDFWRETPEARREVLFPFLWGTVAKEGQLWGNRDMGSSVRVSNGHNFSYPGYNEFLTGYADPKINSNDKILNANTNVFEWLNTKPEFRGRVAASVNWDVLPWISLDTFVGYAAKHAVRTLKPRAMYVSFGETDDWAHEGNYERYLRSAREFDRFIGELWALAQSLPEYRGTTTFVISVDHGRGPAPVAWRNHGKEIVDSAYMWFAVLGPDTTALGERSHTPLIKQAQIAATVGAFVGQDFHGAFPQSAPPIAEVVGAKQP